MPEDSGKLNRASTWKPREPEPDSPPELEEFEAFLTQQGLTCVRREEVPRATYRVVEYAAGYIAVRAESDRKCWIVEVAEKETRPKDWYDTAILRDVLIGEGPSRLPLPDRFKIMQTIWPAILDAFSPERRAETHAQLAALRKIRFERVFPKANV